MMRNMFSVIFVCGVDDPTPERLRFRKIKEIIRENFRRLFRAIPAWKGEGNGSGGKRFRCIRDAVGWDAEEKQCVEENVENDGGD